MTIIALLISCAFFASCDNSEKEAEQLLSSALSKVSLAARDKKNLPRTLYYNLQAQEIFRQLLDNYQGTATASAVSDGSLLIGALPYEKWAKDLDSQVLFLEKMNSDLLSFTFAMGFADRNISLLTMVGNRLAKNGQIDKATEIWNFAKAASVDSGMSPNQMNLMYSAMAKGKLDAGLYAEAKKDAVNSRTALVMAGMANELEKAGKPDLADGLIQDAFKVVQNETGIHFKGILAADILRSTDTIRNWDIPKQIIESLVEDKSKAFSRSKVERHIAIALYHAKTGDKIKADENFKDALATADKEEQPVRKFRLLLKIAEAMHEVGDTAKASRILDDSRKVLDEGYPKASRGRDRALSQMALTAASFGGVKPAMKICLDMNNGDLIKNTYYTISQKTKSIIPLEESLALSIKEDNNFYIADALCDIACWYVENRQLDQAKEFWGKSITTFSHAARLPKPAHFFGGSGASIEILRLSSMVGTLYDTDNLSQEFYDTAFAMAWPVALYIASRQTAEVKGKELALVAQYAPVGFELTVEEQIVLSRWLREQKHFFVMMYDLLKASG